MAPWLLILCLNSGPQPDYCSGGNRSGGSISMSMVTEQQCKRLLSEPPKSMKVICLDPNGKMYQVAR